MGHVVVVGAGIVGLAVAARLVSLGNPVTVLEKESAAARHQTGRNSGVIHSGLYYPPGSLKAEMSRRGSLSMAAFARERGVAVRTPGKLVVATAPEQVPGLLRLAERARANGVPAHLVDPVGARQYEPHVHCVQALRVESTGIIDYVGVCDALIADITEAGSEVRFGTEVVGVEQGGTREKLRVQVRTSDGEEVLPADQLVACAGLHADRVARACGLEPSARIVPFRGEYFSLSPQAEPLVRGLIYPVPDPRFPFLGVHLTRSVDDHVHAGPNAVLALAREGYTWRDVNLRDVSDALSWPGLWRMGRRYAWIGGREIARSLSRRSFARSLAEMVPEIRVEHLIPSPAGVRAQALGRDGALVDDFLLQHAPRQVHVLNAPSPAATCALEIAAHVVDSLEAV